MNFNAVSSFSNHTYHPKIQIILVKSEIMKLCSSSSSYISSSDVSMESVPDEDSHSEQRPQEDEIKVTVDDIGEDIEADQNKHLLRLGLKTRATVEVPSGRVWPV